MKKESITYPMNAMQWETYEEWVQDRAMTEYNTTVAVEMPREKVSADRMAEACQKVLDGQRYMHSHLVEMHDGDLQICEDWDMPNHVHRYEMSDAEWAETKEKFVKPFDLFHEALMRYHVVSTETVTILIVETHHLLFDGIAHKAAWFAVEDVLQGKEPYQQGDMAAEFNRKEIEGYDSEPYRRAQAYYKEQLDGIRFTDICADGDTPWGKMIETRPHFDAATIDAGCQRLGVSFAVVFYAAYALALGEMAKAERVAFYTASHGRSRQHTDRVYGNYLSALPVIIDTNSEQTISDLIKQTKSKLFTSMRHRTYPLFHLLRDIDSGDVGTELSPQGEYIYEYLVVDGIEYPSYHIVTDLSLQHLSTCILIRGDQYEVALDGSDALYTQEQLDQLAQLTGEYAIKLTSEDETNTIGDI